MLVKQHGNSLAQLNDALGLARTDSTLSQIRTRAPHSKTGKPRVMGDDLARKIEQQFDLPTGWMDTPPTYAEIHGEDDPRSKAHILMDSIADEQVHMVLRLITAVAQPDPKINNGR